MGYVILDNSLLQVLTTIERLDILSKHKPVHIAPCVRNEHAKRAPHLADLYLESRLEAGFVKVTKPKFTDAAAKLYHKYEPILGLCDAYGLAWASLNTDDYFFLSDDGDLLKFAEHEGVNAVDLSAVLLACKEAGLTTAQLRQLVHDIETKAQHGVKGQTKKALGI